MCWSRDIECFDREIVNECSTRFSMKYRNLVDIIKLISFFSSSFSFFWFSRRVINHDQSKQHDMLCFVMMINISRLLLMINEYLSLLQKIKSRTLSLQIRFVLKKNSRWSFVIIVSIRNHFVESTITFLVVLSVSSWDESDKNVTLIISTFNSSFINQYFLHQHQHHSNQCHHHSKSD
jgi:hypothetical protein